VAAHAGYVGDIDGDHGMGSGRIGDELGWAPRQQATSETCAQTRRVTGTHEDRYSSSRGVHSPVMDHTQFKAARTYSTTDRDFTRTSFVK